MKPLPQLLFGSAGRVLGRGLGGGRPARLSSLENRRKNLTVRGGGHCGGYCFPTDCSHRRT